MVRLAGLGVEPVADEVETSEFETDEFRADGEGRLNLFGWADAGCDGPPGSPWDGEVDAGWDPSDHLDAWEDCGDDEEAWLASLPPELRAEVEARPAVTCVPWEAGPAQARKSCAGGGLGDGMLPGWLLGRLLAEATADGFSQLTDDELAGLLRGWQRQVAHDHASLAVTVACLADRRAAGSSRAAGHVTDELAIELTLTSRSAARQLELAAGLGRLPEVRDSLLSGFIDWPKACVFADELAVLDDATAGDIASRLAEPAAGWTTGQLRAALARAVLTADPAAAERRKKHARKDTRVEVWHEGSGNAALAGRELRPSAAILLDKKLTSDAAWLSACGVPGTLGELRALAYTTLLSGRDLASILDDPDTWPGGDPGDGRAAEPGNTEPRNAEPDRPAGSIHLTMPVSTLDGGAEPGEANGYGPVDAATSRELTQILARDPATRWCLTLTDRHGAAVAHACARRGPGRRGPAGTAAHPGIRNLPPRPPGSRLRPAAPAKAPGHDPAATLRLPRLPPASPPLRPRPHHPPPPRRPDLRMQPRAAVPATSSREAGTRLAPESGPARRHDLAAAQRTQLLHNWPALPRLARRQRQWQSRSGSRRAILCACLHSMPRRTCLITCKVPARRCCGSWKGLVSMTFVGR